MAIRIYIMPIESATVDGRVYRGPKYFRSRNRLAPDAELQSVSYGAMPFGHEPSCMVAADVIDAAQAIMDGITTLIALQQQQLQIMAVLTQQLTRPKRIVRDSSGRALGVETVNEG